MPPCTGCGGGGLAGATPGMRLPPSSQCHGGAGGGAALRGAQPRPAAPAGDAAYSPTPVARGCGTCRAWEEGKMAAPRGETGCGWLGAAALACGGPCHPAAPRQRCRLGGTGAPPPSLQAAAVVSLEAGRGGARLAAWVPELPHAAPICTLLLSRLWCWVTGPLRQPRRKGLGRIPGGCINWRFRARGKGIRLWGTGEGDGAAFESQVRAHLGPQ